MANRKKNLNRKQKKDAGLRRPRGISNYAGKHMNPDRHCPRCQGEGQRDGEKCRRCQGTGLKGTEDA